MSVAERIRRASRHYVQTTPAPVLTTVCVLLALLFLGLFVYSALARLTYAADLEWMEGALLTHVLEIHEHGHPYPPPSADFVAFIYPPLYYYLLFGLSLLAGVHYEIGRLVSILCTLAIAWLLARIVWRESHSWPNATIAAGLWCATYVIGGTWFDLVRVDMLAFVLALGAVYLLGYGRPGRGPVVFAAVLMCGACFTKQSMAVVELAVVIYLFVARRRELWLYAGITAALAISAFVLLELISGGLFSWYVVVTPFQHGFRTHEYILDQTRFVVSRYPLGLLVLGVALLPQIRARLGPGLGLWIAVALAAMVTTAIMWAHDGRYDNVLISHYLWSTALLAVVAGKLTRAGSAPDAPTPADHGRLGRQIAYLVVLVQMLGLLYDPRRRVPRATDHRAAAIITAKLAAIPGEILAPDHPFLPYQAGKRHSYHTWALMEVSRASKSASDDAARCIADKRYAAVVTAGGALWPAMADTYTKAEQLPRRLDPRTFTGVRKPVAAIFVPKGSPLAPRPRARSR